MYNIYIVIGKTILESKFYFELIQTMAVIVLTALFAHDTFHGGCIFGQSRHDIGWQMETVKGCDWIFFQESKSTVKGAMNKMIAWKGSTGLKILFGLLGGFVHIHFQKTRFHCLQVFLTHSFFASCFDLAWACQLVAFSTKCGRDDVFEKSFIACVKNKHGWNGGGWRMNLDHSCLRSSQRFDAFHIGSYHGSNIDVMKHNLENKKIVLINFNFYSDIIEGINFVPCFWIQYEICPRRHLQSYWTLKKWADGQ